MFNDDTLDKVLDKLKWIGIEQFGDIRTFIDTIVFISRWCYFKKCGDVNDKRC